MEDILDQLLVVSAGLILLGTTWFVWFISGVANNLFSEAKWSWKRMGEDVLKTLLMVLATLAWVVNTDLLDMYTQALGIDISQFIDGVSVVGLVAIIAGGAGLYTYKGYRNIVSFLFKDHTVLQLLEEKTVVPESMDFGVVADPLKQVIGGVYQFLTQPRGSVEDHLEWEKEGGKGSAYNVSIASYDAFRNDVFGKGFNVDGSYGAQCWDGTCLVWQQLGSWLQTGNGCAYGCWTLKRSENTIKGMVQITNKEDIKRGDVLVFRAGEYGHIGFADEDYAKRDYIRLLGQNQGGTAYVGGGACFNTINMSLATFLGAFRYVEWNTAPVPEKKPTPKPTPAPKKSEFEVGDQVVPLVKVDYDGRKLRQYDDTYTITSISGNRAVLSARGAIWAAMNTADLRKV